MEAGWHVSFAVVLSVGAHLSAVFIPLDYAKGYHCSSFNTSFKHLCINQQRYGTELFLGTSAYLLSCMTYVYIITGC